MNWDAVGAVSEAIGAAAVVVSLVYVAVQIRQNTQHVSRGIEADQLAAFERNIESGNRVRELMLVHPDLIKLLLEGSESYRNLDSSSKYRFGLLVRNIFSSTQGAFVRQSAAARVEGEFGGIIRVLDDYLVRPGVQDWLRENKPDWRSDFQELVNQRIEILSQKD